MSDMKFQTSFCNQTFLFYFQGLEDINHVLVLSVIMCSFSNSLIELYFIMVVVTIIEILMAMLFILNCPFRLSVISLTK